MFISKYILHNHKTKYNMGIKYFVIIFMIKSIVNIFPLLRIYDL